MNRPLKILFFIDRLRLGGIQALARDILLHNDRSRMEIEVLNLDDGTDYPLKKTLQDMGFTVRQLKGVWLRTPFDFLKYWKAADRFFKEHHDYDAVHVHSGPKNYYILKAARRWGIPVRVAHSHNTGFQSKNPLSIILGNLLKTPMKRYATRWIGCSEMACDWMFGKNSVKEGKARVILNGIDSRLFVFNAAIRQEVRKELGIEDKFVVGHVGRFESQKNHTFLLDVFQEIVKLRPDAMLVMVGTGSLMEEMKSKAQAIGSDKVLFLGFRDDRNRIMQAMDTFVFPSLYEGLSVVLIEAQASGMPVFASDSTTQEVSYSPHIKFLPLSLSAKEWAKAVVNKGAVERKDMTQTLVKAGFDIHSMIDNFYLLYTGKL